MSDLQNPEAELRAAGHLPDEAIDIGRTAVLLASFDRPRVPVDRYLDHLAELGREVEAEARTIDATEVRGRVAALNGVILERHGYRGDALTYDDLQNANLMRVIDRRKGLPVALGILYMAAGQAIGWQVQGLSFPGHFLIRIDHAGERAIVDPFRDGRILGPGDLREMLKSANGPEAELAPEHYAAVGNREVLLRLQNNIKLRRARAGDAEGAIAVLERMLWIAPSRAELLREAAALQAESGNLHAAIAHLERLVAIERTDFARHRASMRLQELRRRLN